MLDSMAKLDVFIDEIILLFDLLQVGMDFWRERIVVRPQLDLPRELIVD